MMKIILCLALLVALSAAEGRQEDLLKRLLEVLDERQDEKRGMYSFGYDAVTDTIRCELRICKVGDKGPPCPGRDAHLLEVFKEGPKRTLVYSAFIAYTRGFNKAPRVSEPLDNLVKGDKYMAVACVLMDTGEFDFCNSFEFTAGTTEPFYPKRFDKVPDWANPNNNRNPNALPNFDKIDK